MLFLNKGSMWILLRKSEHVHVEFSLFLNRQVKKTTSDHNQNVKAEIFRDILSAMSCRNLCKL